MQGVCRVSRGCVGVQLGCVEVWRGAVAVESVCAGCVAVGVGAEGECGETETLTTESLAGRHREPSKSRESEK